jgi:DNA-binding transcriptional regulator YiaG
MTDPEDVERARRALGKQLALLRKAAGYSQHQFAPLTSYGRSTIANVEVGRQRVPRAACLLGNV